MDIRGFSSLLFIPAIGMWTAGLFQPALKAPGPGQHFHYTGLNCLLLGWFGFLGRPLWALPWSANVLFWLSIARTLLRKQPERTALILSLVAIPLALTTLANRTIEMDEAGNSTAVVPGPGFYLWLGGMATLAAAQLARAEGRV